MVHDRPSDFVLLAKDQSFVDMLDPRPDETFDLLPYSLGSDLQNPFPDFPSNAYDLYPSSSTFSTHTPNCYNPADSVLVKPKEISNPGHRQMAALSTPSPSVTQSLDHPPSTISSTSGASARSTTSSIDGSPYSHATSNIPAQEHWVDSHQGLGIVAGIVHNESYGNDIYSLNHLEHELVLSGDKLSNHFVGELERFPSSSVSNSGSVSQFSLPPTTMVPLVLDTNVGSRDITLDGILNEANEKIDNFTHSYSSARASLSDDSSCHQLAAQVPSPSQSNGSFKSPMTPASAYSPLPPSSTTSPSSARQYRLRKHSFVDGHDSRMPGVHRKALANSHRWSPYDQPATSLKSPGHLYRDPVKSPFFGQSSGRFIAPLESSCWFSLIVLSSPFLSSDVNLFYDLYRIFFWMHADSVLNRSCSHTIIRYIHCSRYYHTLLWGYEHISSPLSDGRSTIPYGFRYVKS